jgi:anhydro-N-acetylmuramic acid kinase
MSLYLGLMSGTSMDAIDAALVDFETTPFRVVATSATAFEPKLKRRAWRCSMNHDRASLDEIGRVDVEVARAFAAAALSLLEGSGTRARAGGGDRQPRPDAAPPGRSRPGLHLADRRPEHRRGDDRHHRGRRFSPARRRGRRPGRPARTGFSRSGISQRAEDRAIVNIGGIANLTVLRRGMPVLGFDTGPGNRLLDAWISRHQHLEFDRDGSWASAGRTRSRLLASLLGRAVPRAAGAEEHRPRAVQSGLARPQLCDAARDPQDVQATLLEYTAATIAAAVRRHAPGRALCTCGGGAHNAGLLAALASRVAPAPVATTAALGLDPDYVEAIAFAWFARRTLAGLPSSAASVTGRAGARILGGIYQKG